MLDDYVLCKVYKSFRGANKPAKSQPIEVEQVAVKDNLEQVQPNLMVVENVNDLGFTNGYNGIAKTLVPSEPPTFEPSVPSSDDSTGNLVHDIEEGCSTYNANESSDPFMESMAHEPISYQSSTGMCNELEEDVLMAISNGEEDYSVYNQEIFSLPSDGDLFDIFAEQHAVDRDVHGNEDQSQVHSMPQLHSVTPKRQRIN
ncbi:uncharacterized protein LOC143851739 [Tasmannia lanceolata]|uniref:uncharacterized protein LOC143851739 n=1 Tax=Tasmannia lanceolata TaxID=3420 RepID=UPI004063BD13